MKDPYLYPFSFIMQTSTTFKSRKSIVILHIFCQTYLILRIRRVFYLHKWFRISHSFLVYTLFLDKQFLSPKLLDEEHELYNDFSFIFYSKNKYRDTQHRQKLHLHLFPLLKTTKSGFQKVSEKKIIARDWR